MASHKLQINIRAFTTAMCGLLLACGSGTKAVQSAGELDQNSATAVAGCTSTSCPAANMDVASSGFSNQGILLGYVNEAVPWDFKGVDGNSADRRVGVLLGNIPEGAKMVPDLTGEEVFTEVKLVWTPDRTLRSSQDLIIQLRDLSRCEVTESNKKNCHVKQPLDAYDKKVTVAWQIVNRGDTVATTGVGGIGTGTGSYVNVSGTNCGLQQATTDGQIMGAVLQNGMRAISGGTAGIIGTLGSILASGLGGSNTPTTPVQCQQ